MSEQLIDGFGRIHTNLRISVTDRCNIRCFYCMPAENVQFMDRQELMTFEEIERFVRIAVPLGLTKIRLTGGEPLVKRGIVRLVGMIAAIEGLEHLAMTTNGTLLAPRARELAEAGLDSVNVSLDTLDPARYRELTRGGAIEDALAGIAAARAAGLPVKLNMVVMEGGDPAEITRMREFADGIDARVQLINHYELFRKKGDTYAFDRPPECAGCNRIRLTADGMLKPCLHSDQEVPLDFSRLEESLRAAVDAKPLHGGTCTNRSMPQIGG